MKLILLGAPGCGKGTQAKKISDKYSIPHISTGDIFRENIQKQTPIGLKVKKSMDTGNLCPDDLTIELVKDRLEQPDVTKAYLLDGFPRNIFQAEALEDISEPDMVININVDFAVIERRVTGRRSCVQCKGTFHVDNLENEKICPVCSGELVVRKDDTPEIVKDRIEVYKKQTSPLIEFYQDKGKLVNIDGNKDVEQVFSDIVKVLDK